MCLTEVGFSWLIHSKCNICKFGGKSGLGIQTTLYTFAFCKVPWAYSHVSVLSFVVLCEWGQGRHGTMLMSAKTCTIAVHNLFYCTRNKFLSVFHTIIDLVNVFIFSLSLSLALFHSLGLWGLGGPCLLPGVWEPRSMRHQYHFPSVAVVTSMDSANSSR